MKAVYLTKGVLDIFDEMGYSSSFRKIISGLEGILWIELIFHLHKKLS
jgi:hypothetical protein